VVILPYWLGRHPDHYTCSTLGYEACFLAGLSRLQLQKEANQHSHAPADIALLDQPHRPFKIIYATLYYDIRPTFVVDITEQFESRLESIYAYKSQYTDQEAGSKDFPAHAEIRERVATMANFYGMLAGVKYAEPFLQKEVGLVEDVMMIPVKSI
jgi:LmbE family N-acetylglucosaminyl deacetylase